MIYYNDRDGIEAMTGWKRSSSGMERAAGDVVEWGGKSGRSTLRNYRGGNRRFVLDSMRDRIAERRHRFGVIVGVCLPDLHEKIRQSCAAGAVGSETRVAVIHAPIIGV